MRLAIAVMAVTLCAGFSSAQAAAPTWECAGPAFVCGEALLPQSNKNRVKVAYKQHGTRIEHNITGDVFEGIGEMFGVASYYGSGSRTASGERFNPSEMTAAHRTLPFGTRVRVTNTNNGRSVVVRINDRGPFVHNRVIDLSTGAASAIGMIGSGTAHVRIARL